MTRIPAVLSAAGLGTLVDLLRARGWTVVAPTERDGAVVLAEIASAAELPARTGDEHQPGRYRLRPRDDDAWFGFAAPANSCKSFLHPPVALQATVRRGADGNLEVAAGDGNAPAPRYAFLGVRACDLAAVDAQDRVLRAGNAVDAGYAARREQAMFIAVACAEPSSVCFCASMGTGPRPRAGYDVLLTELLDGEHRFLAEAGTERGAELLDAAGTREATADERAAAEAVTAYATAHMGRTLDPEQARAALQHGREHPQWQLTAARCLACGNCTLACPTCFCVDVVDGDDASGELAARARRWASCFSLEFSYIHGGTVRSATAARYRQWASHKFSTWWDQFGTAGCVGCGRCITWCPAGIDVTAEIAAVAEEAQP